MCLASLVCGAFVLLFFLGLKLRIWLVRVPKPQTLNEVSVLDRVPEIWVESSGFWGLGFKSMGLIRV